MPSIHRSSAVQKRHLFIICAVVLLGLATYAFRDRLGSGDPGPLFSDERNRYLVLEFMPKYKVNDCVVRFDLHLKAAKGRFAVDLYDSFQRYLSDNESKIGYMMPMQIGMRGSAQTPDIRNIVQHRLVFADQCERRFKLFEAMAAYAEDLHGDQFFLEQVPVEEPMDAGGIYWLDSPDYDPDYWPTFHDAMRGDGKAFLDLFRFEHKVDNERQHLFYSLAEHYLPRGALKDEAREGKEGSWGKIKPERQGLQKMVIEDWKQKIQRYNSQ